MTVREITQCRACGSKGLRMTLDLGTQYVSNFLLPGETGLKAPLVLLRCQSCSLVQLSHSVDPDIMYRHFWYQSSISSSMRSSLEDVAMSAMKIAPLGNGETVIDIGSNDGTLLDFYPSRGVYKVGFEPAANVAEVSVKKLSGYIFQDYFNAKVFLESNSGFSRAKIITAIAMFYDLENPRGFLSDVAKCLRDDGVFIVQMNYLGSMLRNRTFDNICHEHLEYYSLLSLENLLRNTGMEIFRVEVNEVNGGSFRSYLGFKGAHHVDDSVPARRLVEARMGLTEDRPYTRFRNDIDEIRDKLWRLVLINAVRHGKSVYVLGASTRGNTLLQTCGFDSKTVKGAVDKNPDKWGRRTVGSNIPIMSREEAGSPDYFLVLPYHFLDEFMAQEKSYLEKGGKFIVPIPEPVIVP